MAEKRVPQEDRFGMEAPVNQMLLDVITHLNGGRLALADQIAREIEALDISIPENGSYLTSLHEPAITAANKYPFTHAASVIFRMMQG